MARPGWWNDNRFRSYPFLRGAVNVTGTGDVQNITDNTIVDAGFIAGLASGYVEGVHSIWLSEVSRSGDTITFKFSSDAPGLAGLPLSFSRDINDDEYSIEHAELLADAAVDSDASGTSQVSDSYSYSEEDSSCPPEPLWSGFMVTGRLDELFVALGDGDTWIGQAFVEPCNSQSMYQAYVSSINLGNADRTRVSAAADCPEPEWAYPVGEDVVHINRVCLRGDIRIKPGYNASISQSNANSQIEIAAVVGAGESQACGTVPAFPGETPPTGSTQLEGGSSCNELVRSINGIGGQNLNFIAGRGVDITPVPGENKLILNVNMRQLAVCYDEISAVSETV